ncbi:MAG TPA: exosortase-associated EpsI family protein [Verrucomicrobiae bacterium]|jgi:hypothetical protein
MNHRAKKILTVALLAAVVLAVIWDQIPLRDAQARIAGLPVAGLGFSSVDVPLNDTEKSIFGAARVVKRIYRIDRRNFMVVIIDGARNRHAVHDPTYCFRSAGWNIRGENTFPVPDGVAAALTLQRDGETRPAAYWFSDRQSRHGSVVRCWWQMACRRMTFGASGPDPVLVVVQPLDAKAVAWDLLPVQLPFLFNL